MHPITKPSPYYKYVLPIIIFGLLVYFSVALLIRDQVDFSPVIVLVFLALMAVAIFKSFVWDLVDEVHDWGDALVLRKGDLEQRVELEDITQLEYSPNFPPSATIWTNTTGPLGLIITFRLPATFNPFSTPSQIAELQERIYQARRRAK